MILTPLVIAQLFSIGTGLGSQVAKMTGNDEVAQKLGIASMVSGAVSSAGGALKDAFTAPETGLGIANFKGDITKDYGAFKDLPKDMTKLPKDIGGFGKGALKLPEGWNIPKKKGLFDFTPEDALQDQWNPYLKIK